MAGRDAIEQRRPRVPDGSRRIHDRLGNIGIGGSERSIGFTCIAMIGDVGPAQGPKAMLLARERVWIGSMNFDPRSAGLNTEMGVTIESKDLAADLIQRIERDALPVNSWRVGRDDRGKLTWTNDQQTVTHQPARSFRQRVEDVIFMTFPKEPY